jgi:hypothetical protein
MVYFANGARCCKPSDEKVKPNRKTLIGFRFNRIRMGFKGALMYRLRRRATVPVNEHNTDVSSTETVEDASANIKLLIAWEIKRSGAPCVCLMMMTHDENITWSQDQLKRLCSSRSYQTVEYDSSIQDIWHMTDGTAIRTTLEPSNQKEYKLSIKISNNTENDSSRDLVRVNSRM